MLMLCKCDLHAGHPHKVTASTYYRHQRRLETLQYVETQPAAEESEDKADEYIDTCDNLHEQHSVEQSIVAATNDANDLFLGPSEDELRALGLAESEVESESELDCEEHNVPNQEVHDSEFSEVVSNVVPGNRINFDYLQSSSDVLSSKESMSI